MRRFMLKKNARAQAAGWLNRQTVYEGKLISMTSRVVRLFAPDPADQRQHVDLPYDWVIPVR
jgi:hypothetical protein